MLAVPVLSLAMSPVLGSPGMTCSASRIARPPGTAIVGRVGRGEGVEMLMRGSSAHPAYGRATDPDRFVTEARR
jgi:hypothetical protein